MGNLRKIRNSAFPIVAGSLLGIIGLIGIIRFDQEMSCRYHVKGENYERVGGTYGLSGCIRFERNELDSGAVEDSVCIFDTLTNTHGTCYFDGGGRWTDPESREWNADGLVDRIFRNEQPFLLEREHNFYEFRREFERGDMLLQGAKERFEFP